MPLFTDQLGAARIAYNALEMRALSAEMRVIQLTAALAATGAEAPNVALLRQRIANLEAQTVELNNQLDDLKRARADASLQQLIEAMALSAALGEASMPGRTIESLSASVKAHVTADAGGVALRFQPPELGAVNLGALGTTNFAIAKVPPPAGTTAPGNFHALLLETQAIYGRVNTPGASDLARKIVLAATQAITDTGSWSVPYLASLAATLADLQNQLAAGDNRPSAGALRARCQALAELSKVLAAKSNPVAGDLYALTTVFGETTIAAGAHASVFTP
jgi:hypothetical protein